MAEAAAKKKTLLEEFMSGCKKGFYIGAENIMPAMVLAYSLILFLNITGLMDIIANAVAPVMALFGLPGGAIVALISAFFAKAAGAATAASLYAEGVINAAQATILFPATITMGTLVGAFCALRINFRRQPEAPCAAFGNSRYRRFAVDDYCKSYT